MNFLSKLLFESEKIHVGLKYMIENDGSIFAECGCAQLVLFGPH